MRNKFFKINIAEVDARMSAGAGRRPAVAGTGEPYQPRQYMLKVMNHLKKYIFLGLLSACATVGGAAELPVGDRANSWLGLTVDNIYRTDNGKLAVEVVIDLGRADLKSQYEQVFTPYIYSDTDTVRFDPFSVTGHKRLLANERNRRVFPITFYKEALVPTKLPHPNAEVYVKYPGPGTYEIKYTTNWKDWMETATFSVESEVYGCARCLRKLDGVGEEWMPLAQTDFVQRSYFPEFLYVTPVAEAVKMREISARAYIDFPVNRTEIYPDYRRNPEELAKIRATIDSVRNDRDINITSLHISGTASPEGSYQNNIRLASGRTASLKDYVQSLYRFPQGLITTSYEPVDWQGLAEFLRMVVYRSHYRVSDGSATAGQAPIPGTYGVMPSDSIRYDQFQNINYDPATIAEILPDASAILGIVNSDIEPFARNSKIRTTYPSQYAWLLENVYPALRHSDYRIEFEIKTYTDVSEILEVMSTRPQNLSLAELFVAANSQEPGSELYNRAFELAVTMYPEDETANLNAATYAMQRGDLISAERYLAKVEQETPEADYAKAMLMLMQGQTEEALQMFGSLANSLSPEVARKAAEAKNGIEEVNRANGRNFIQVE
ncbi:MAG: hypothetical protein J1E16_09090 [Muribaculaceae bacterium]|nr:hypothetical protein [Muribaculaceae bacterium]